MIFTLCICTVFTHWSQLVSLCIKALWMEAVLTRVGLTLTLIVQSVCHLTLDSCTHMHTVICFNHGHSNGRVSAFYFFVKNSIRIFLFRSKGWNGRSPVPDRPPLAQRRSATAIGGPRPPSCPASEGPHQELVLSGCRPSPDWDLTHCLFNF